VVPPAMEIRQRSRQSWSREESFEDGDLEIAMNWASDNHILTLPPKKLVDD